MENCKYSDVKTPIKVINKSNNPLPEYQTSGSSGMDFRAFVEGEPIVLKPGKRCVVHTGLYMEIPIGIELQIRSRSGLSLKKGICLANGIGTIDSDYREEIRIILINLGEEDFIINNGDRIAQGVFSRYEKVSLYLSDKLNETDRKGGFGHTGIN